ncbi:chondroitin proteoglycan-2-like isoform X2 [Coccinella septempunctata]|uniref:chondroitin proteoglycan-2-like isoform X2 n=1 Tax=Coccinella septempunctata TaxID=41139 RepID=UPI001D0981C6|nr:chondroitin proteoglycan-2-like isoform X2 [Coccinella septempunctata]
MWISWDNQFDEKMIAKISAIVLLATSVACVTIGNLEPCPELSQLIPDPKNCSRFYECTLAGWVGEACNPGLEFNPANLQCDYPQNVKCANETAGNVLRDVPTLEPCTVVDQLKPDVKNCSRFYECTQAGWWVGEPCIPGLLFNPDTLQCDYPANVKCATEQQKEVMDLAPCTKLDKLIPDPKNCSRFYECTQAGWVGLFCYPGLYFNPVTSRCDYSWNVACENDAPAEVPRDVPTLEPCTVVDQLKPDVKNCSRFYECTQAGWWVGEPCIAGLLFNPDTLQCDYPANVKCATEQQKEEILEPSCSSQNFDELFPDPSSCGRFLQCSDLGLISMPCPGDLLFNRDSLKCDYSWNVTC